MEINYNLVVTESDDKTKLFHPFVQFRFEQMNDTPHCMNDDEIDAQINILLDQVESLRIKAKNKLKKSKERISNMK